MTYSGTQGSSWTFDPLVWSDHTMAYFRTKLCFGALAHREETLTRQPGDTYTWPFYNTIGKFEKPTELASLTVDALTDGKFSCTVKEFGKAVAFTDTAFVQSGDHGGRESILRETQRQIGTRMAEICDEEIIAVLETDKETCEGFTATQANHTMNIREINAARIHAFGDRMDEAVAIIMHSNDYVQLMNDPTQGFLKADATMPLWGTPGFVGQILGMNLIVNDQCPMDATASAALGANCYASYILKPQAYGLVTKQDMIVNTDRDILARQDIIAATSWFGVSGFHAKFSDDDLRIARCVFNSKVGDGTRYNVPATAPAKKKKAVKE